MQPNMALSPVEFPAQYAETCTAFLAGYWQDRSFEMYNCFGFTDLLPPPDVRQFLIAETLEHIARAAAGEYDRAGDLVGLVHEHVQTLVERLFAAPGLPGVYEIPEAFWGEPIGQMVSRALIWCEGDELITLAQAAELAGITVQAMSQRVDAGKLRSYSDPDAKSRQGRRLVRRSDVAR